MHEHLLGKVISLDECGESAILTLYKSINNCIGSNWNSLCFANNTTLFAEITLKDRTVKLTTRGDVYVIDDKCYYYTNSSEDIIREFIEGGYAHEVHKSNWFEIYISRYENGEEIIEAHEKFIAKPYNLRDLEEELIYYTTYLIKVSREPLPYMDTQCDDEYRYRNFSKYKLSKRKHQILSEKEIYLDEYDETAFLTMYNHADNSIWFNWNSLFFADNTTVLADIALKNRLVKLTTRGDVSARVGSHYLTNKDYSDICDYIEADYALEIYKSNWFEIIISRYENGEEIVEAYEKFEATPSTLEELEEELILYTAYLMKISRNPLPVESQLLERDRICDDSWSILANVEESYEGESEDDYKRRKFKEYRRSEWNA